MKTKVFLILALFLSSSAFSDEHSEKNAKVFGKLGYGFISVLHHNSQWGKEGTDFSYVDNGGQNVLLPTWRAEAGLTLNKNHKMSFVYQPIFVTAEVTLKEDLKVDDLTFEKGKNQNNH